jgi:DNA-directed RNA polymerase subunit omega
MNRGRRPGLGRKESIKGAVNPFRSSRKEALQIKRARQGGTPRAVATRHAPLVVGKPGSARKADLPILLLHSLAKTLVCLARSNTLDNALNAELTRKALEKVGNPNVLVNLISRRVRQLNSGSGALSRPLVEDPGHLGAADIALLEIIEDKVGFEMPEITELTRPTAKKRKKH